MRRLILWATIAALGYVVGASVAMRIAAWQDHRRRDGFEMDRATFMAWARRNGQTTPAYGVPVVTS